MKLSKAVSIMEAAFLLWFFYKFFDAEGH